MERQKYFVPMLSLKEMTLRKSVIYFLTERDILESIKEFPFKELPGSRPLWQKTVEDRVKEKILKLPELLRIRMNLLVKPICMQIVEWEKFIELCLYDEGNILNIQILKQLSWTSAAAIDYKKTAGKIIRLQTLDVADRFEIACGHCLVDSLPLVWKEMSGEVKENYNTVIIDESWLSLFQERLLPIYWASVLRGQEYKLLERCAGFYKRMFIFSIRRGNEFSTEYFFQKLTIEDRRLFLSDTFNGMLYELSWDRLKLGSSGHDKTGVFLYLLSQTVPEQQMKILRDRPGFIFYIFLHWPWHDLFLEKTDLIWILVPEESTYVHLVSHIIKKIISSYYYFPELVQEFFRRSPNAFRKIFVDEECRLEGSLIYAILCNEDVETAKVILRNIDSEDKFRLVGSSERVLWSLTHLIGTKGQGLVELFFREAFPSEEERERLKEIIRVFIIENGVSKWQKTSLENGVSKWQKTSLERLFESLDENRYCLPSEEKVGRRDSGQN